MAAEQVALLRWESRSEVDPIIPVCPVLLPLDKNLLVMGTISNAVDCIDFDHGSTSCALLVIAAIHTSGMQTPIAHGAFNTARRSPY